MDMPDDYDPYWVPEHLRLCEVHYVDHGYAMSRYYLVCDDDTGHSMKRSHEDSEGNPTKRRRTRFEKSDSDEYVWGEEVQKMFPKPSEVKNQPYPITFKSWDIPDVSDDVSPGIATDMPSPISVTGSNITLWAMDVAEQSALELEHH